MSWCEDCLLDVARSASLSRLARRGKIRAGTDVAIKIRVRTPIRDWAVRRSEKDAARDHAQKSFVNESMQDRFADVALDAAQTLRLTHRQAHIGHFQIFGPNTVERLLMRGARRSGLCERRPGPVEISSRFERGAARLIHVRAMRFLLQRAMSNRTSRAVLALILNTVPSRVRRNHLPSVLLPFGWIARDVDWAGDVTTS